MELNEDKILSKYDPTKSQINDIHKLLKLEKELTINKVRRLMIKLYQEKKIKDKQYELIDKELELLKDVS